jgi:DNA end-binding protein Ku
MPRAIWTGAISFGLVNVPIKLYSATSQKTVRFHQLHESDHARIRQKRWCPVDDAEVPYDEIVKGYEIAPDQYVVITNEELEAMNPRATKTIDIEDFVDLADIDPVFFDSAYYLAPNTGGAKPYRLLLDAMRESGKVAVGHFVLRTKQQMCALRPSGSGDVLVLNTMLYGDEVNDPEGLDELDAATETDTTKRELAMAQQLIDSLSSEWDPTKYRDTYREEVIALIERKASGEEIAVQPATEEPKPVPDLMAALEASLAAVRSDESEEKPKKRSSSRSSSKSDSGSGSNGKASKSRSRAKSKS